MLKLYYIVLTVIVGLVIWLVADFVQNSAEARDILSNINKTGGSIKPPSIDPPPVLPPHPGELPDIFNPKQEAVKTVQLPQPAASGPNYILTGTILEPDGPKAFIANKTTKEEKICTIGDMVEDWEVIEIVSEEVKLKNRRGSIISLPMQKPWDIKKLGGDSRIEIPSAIANIPGAEDIIKRFMAGTEPAEQVEKSIEAVVNSLPPDYVKGLIKQFTGISEEDIPKDDTKLGEYAKNLFKVVQGKPVETTSAQLPQENISFTLRVNPDNSPITPQTQFKPGDRRIYACFTNQGSLQGLSKVVTRWTNKTIGETVLLETKSINPGASYNFVWKEKREGWPVGEYEVELLKTQTFEKIASGKFTIVP
ncbi:MAG: hypothetical protein AB1599_09550 [Planctomycetota bacterium]